MRKESDIPIYEPSNFNIFDLLSFKYYEMLPRWYPYDPNPMFCHHLGREFRNIAWHSKYTTVFPHTLQYKMLRAITEEDLQLVTKILKNKQFDVNCVIDKKYNLSSLQFAAIKNKYPIIELLLMYGANINLSDDYGNTPLMLAVMNNNLESINSLMKNGCDRNQKNIYGLDSIDRAKGQNHIVDFIKNYPQTKRRFPKFRVKLDIEDKLNNSLWSFIKKYKVFDCKPLTSPFNNFKGNYLINFTGYSTIEELSNVN